MKSEMGVELKITADGRVVIPADVRRRMGVARGGVLALHEDEYGVTLSTPGQRVAKAQALYAQYSRDRPDASVDAFLVDKRRDAAAERG